MNKSIVKEAAIYRSGCILSREGKIRLEPGLQNVILDTLAGQLDVDSLSLSLPENLAGANVQVEPLSEKEQEELLKDISERLNELNSKITVREKQIEMWNLNADFSNKDSLSIADMAEYIEKLPERVEKIQQELRQLQKQKKELDKEKEELDKEACAYVIRADIQAQEEGEYPFILRYKDPRAYWTPIYEIHTKENDELSILLKAKIYQFTTEDLNKVKLTLYTADPVMSADIPQLHPEHLNFRIERPRMMAKNAMLGAAPAMMQESMVYEEEADEDGYAMNDVVAPVGTAVKEETMTRYDLDGIHEVKDRKPLILDIEGKTIPCRYHVIAIPKLEDCGYLAAEVKVNDIAELLNTEAVIYHDNTYIGEINIDVDSAEEKYDISLGRDETIRLRRKQNKKYTSNVLLKSQKKLDYEYELSISSTKNKPCQVTMYDQLPVSDDKTITVEAGNIAKAKLEEETGRLTWEFELGPQEHKSFTLAYAISYPKDKKLNI